MVSALVESVLHSLDDALLPTANWVLKLIDVHDQLDDATGIKVTLDDIRSFQKNVAESFIADLKNNISSRFASQDVVSAFSVFNPQKMPDVSSSHLASYGEDSIDVLINQYGAEKPAHTVQGEEFMKPPLITSEVHTEWKTFRCFLSKKPEEDMKAQLRELARNDMLVTMFPNLSALSNMCLSIPAVTASVERSLSDETHQN